LNLRDRVDLGPRDGASIWVTNNRGNSVSKLRASDGKTLGTFAVGTNPRVDPDVRKLFRKARVQDSVIADGSEGGCAHKEAPKTVKPMRRVVATQPYSSKINK
jgi:hypothetical protein